MPLGTGSGDFYTPAHGRYAVQLQSITDGKVQHYPAADGKPARDAVPAVWSLLMFNADGSPVLDPKKPGTQAVWEAMSSQTTGYGNDGKPSKAREYLTAFLASKGIVFPDENTEEDVARFVGEAVGQFAWVTVGENPVRTQKTRTIIRGIEPLIQGAAAPPPPPAPAAFVAAALPVAEAIAAAPTALPVQAPFVPTAPVEATALAAGIPSMPAMPFGQAPA